MSVAIIKNLAGGGGKSLEDINSLSMTLPDSRYLIQMPVQGYSKIRFRNYGASQSVGVTFETSDHTEISTITIVNATSWSQYYDVPTNAAVITLRNKMSANIGFYIGLMA